MHVFNRPIPDDEMEWAQLVAQAMWVKSFEAKTIAYEISKLFAAPKSTGNKPKRR